MTNKKKKKIKGINLNVIVNNKKINEVQKKINEQIQLTIEKTFTVDNKKIENYQAEVLENLKFISEELNKGI